MQQFGVFIKIFSFLAIPILFSGVLGFNLVPIPRRWMCFQDTQPNCNEECTSAYPDLKWSISNLTEACTWFLLYTRKNMDQPELLHKCGGKLPPNTNFNPDRKLLIIITTYRSSYCNIELDRQWKAQFLMKGDYNVLIIDWAWGSFYDYYSSIHNTKIVGKQAIIVLKNIQKQIETPLKIHIIGHSVANGVSAIIGQGVPVDRITALDPAGPGFPESTPLSERLDRSDAKLVDVWHTNAGDCIPALGINYDAGHIDYYINGGTRQPTCYSRIAHMKAPPNEKFSFMYVINEMYDISQCCHSFAAQLFKMSINPEGCQFIGVKCNKRNLDFEDIEESLRLGHCNECGENGENCEIMGMDFGNYIYKSSNVRGRYYVRTSLKCDYCDNSHVKLQGFADEYKQAVEYREDPLNCSVNPNFC